MTHIEFLKHNVTFSITRDPQNPTESEVKKLVVEHRADDRVTFEVFLPIMQVKAHFKDCICS